MPSFDIVTNGDGSFHVHRAGCADLTKSRHRDIMRLDAVTDLRDIVLYLYPAEDFGYDPNLDWQWHAGDVRVIACAEKILK